MLDRIKSLFAGHEPREGDAAPAATKPPREMVDPADIGPPGATVSGDVGAAPAAIEPPLPEMAAEPADRARDTALEERVIEAMKTVRDPEIPVNLFDLGLVYDLDIGADGNVFIEMTLTTPHCPSAAELPGEMEAAVRAVPGVTDVRLKLVFSPPWTPDRMSEEARLELGML